MLRTRFSRPSKHCQSGTLPLPWRIQRRLLLDKKTEHNPEPEISRSNPAVAQDQLSSRTITDDDDHKPLLVAYNIKSRIWDWTKHTSINLRHYADDFTAKSKSTFSQLGSWLNQITGYEEIETLKRGVVKQGKSPSFMCMNSTNNSIIIE